MMNKLKGKKLLYFISLYFLVPLISIGQTIKKEAFDEGSGNDDYYLSVMPKSNQIKGTLVLLTSFLTPEDLLPETKLQNVAYVNDFLFVCAPLKGKLFADNDAVNRINTILTNIIKKYGLDKSKIVLAGYDDAGGVSLRYTELTYQYPMKYLIQPRAVFCINSSVDLLGLWHWAENQIKENYPQAPIADAHYYIDSLTKEIGNPYTNSRRYKELTPFYRESDSVGNEIFLKNVPVRLYYDIDINWQLNQRRNSLYDTYIPD
jgi:hypothetical protein